MENSQAVSAATEASKDGDPAAKRQRKTRWGQPREGNLSAPASTKDNGEAGSSNAPQSMGTQAAAPAAIVLPHVPQANNLAMSGLNINVLAAATAAREALEKARKAALFQKKMQEQIQELRANSIGGSTQTILSVSGHGTNIPRPLRLDKFGREVDEEGKVVPIKPLVHSTLKINLSRAKEEKQKEESIRQKLIQAQEVSQPETLEWFDSSMMGRKANRKKALQFVDSGVYIRQEQQMRRQAEAKSLGIDMNKLRQEKKDFQRREEARIAALELGKLRHSEAGTGDRAGGKDEDVQDDFDDFNPNLIPLGGAGIAEKTLQSVGSNGFRRIEWANDEPEDVEWWDTPLLVTIPENGGLQEGGERRASYTFFLEKLNSLIQHPFFEGSEKAKKAIFPVLYLTVKERKKLRRRRRQEKEREKQDKIRMGLMPPPPPKVKLANLMRVLGDSAVADPSKVEKDVREQMKQRMKLHEQLNEERKLTPFERSKKKVMKWKQEDGECLALLFLIKDLSSRKNLYKIDINAKQFHLSGCCIVCPDFLNIVVVEGGARAIKGFKKLMLNRIKWEDADENAKDEADADEDDVHGNSKTSGKFCNLIWEGVVKQKSFFGWKLNNMKTVPDACQIFKDNNAEHYWKMVSSSQPQIII